MTITKDEIEKAFTDPVEFRLSPWSTRTGLRRPTVSEIKARVMAILSRLPLHPPLTTP